MSGKHLIVLLLSLSLSGLSVAIGSSLFDSRIIKGTQCSSRKLSTTDGGSSLTNTSTTIDVDDFYIDDLLPFCPDGYFCGLTINENAMDGGNILGLCKPCLGRPERCITDIYGEMVFVNGSVSALERASVEECWEQCGSEENRCSSTEPCAFDLFCNPDDDEFVGNGDGDDNGLSGSGYCQACPYHIFNCLDLNLTDTGYSACLSSCELTCYSTSYIVESNTSSISSNGSATITTANQRSLASSVPFHGSPEITVTGPIVNCGLGLEPCEGATGSICLIERGKIEFYKKIASCYAGGGIGVVIFNTESGCKEFNGTLIDYEALVPSVSLSHLDGMAILEDIKAMPLNSSFTATLSVSSYFDPGRCEVGCFKEKECEGKGMVCNFDNGEFGACVECSPTFENNFCQIRCGSGYGDDQIIPCAEGLFCKYENELSGTCMPCPKETGQECFYSNLNQKGAFECAAVCADGVSQELKTPPCKFCPKADFNFDDIGDGSITSMSENEVAEPCEFCARSTTLTCSKQDRWDMLYPNRTMRMFGDGATCWVVAEFYRDKNIPKDHPSCVTARLFSHICGCSDSPAYAGANTSRKQAALVWMPRISAILSILGSTLMILDILLNRKGRKKILSELFVALCSFDILGAFAYAFVTLPTPTEDFLYGSNGNVSTCTTQGFFIQMGTISSYINVSLSFYYLLTIRYGWREKKLRDSRVYYMLFLVPITIGLVFAFVGIPYYDNMWLWCNNAGNYWSEIPVVIAILIATGVMISLCLYVYNEEKASDRYRVGASETLTMKFFWQSLYYLAAFYLTWPPYLALQFMLASGNAYSHYGFFLLAGTVVPLQGFWNFLVYARTREITAVSIICKSIMQGVSMVGHAASNGVTGLTSFFNSSGDLKRSDSFDNPRSDLDLNVTQGVAVIEVIVAEENKDATTPR